MGAGRLHEQGRGTVEQVGEGGDAGSDIARACRSAGAKRGHIAYEREQPMLATPGKPFTHPDWVFEIK